MTTRYAVDADVAVLTLDNPPVNGLGYDTRRALVDGLDRALADPAVVAIVIAGAGKSFTGGADIREFGTPKAMQEPNLLSVIAAFEASTKPVVVAIHGVCMGGGLELALGCHYRLAAPGTQIALPEVKLGLVPGAGGTQRLPRAIGLEPAMNMIVSGNPVASDALASIPGQALFDRIVDGDLLAEAKAFARERAATTIGKEAGPHPRVRDRRVEHPNLDAFVLFARTTVGAMAKDYPAAQRCVDCVEAAARKRFDDGMRFERETFASLMMSPESRALRHAFFAERAASKIADVPDDTPQREVRKVGVIGAGMMGGGIAMNFLNAGLPVVILETKQEALDRGVATIRKHYEGSVRKGSLSETKFAQRMTLLQPTLDYADLADCDLIVEAVFEEIGVKQAVFERLDAIAKPGAILASNTSTLDLDRIAAFTTRPQDVIGLHFFSPAHVMKLLEVVRGKATAKDVLATAMAVAKKIRKTAVVSGVCDGFIGNRMIEQYSRQAMFLLEEGALPAQVDAAAERFGFMMGPFRMSDLAGNDIGWAIRKRRYVEQPELTYSKVADALCELGRFGQKTGAGWYDYRPGDRKAHPSAVVDAMIVEHSAAAGIARRTIGDDEIVERLVYALVNEGAKILDEGIAAKAGDIDMVYLFGYGFPPFRGGPMRYADEIGLFNVVRAMRRYAAADVDGRQAGAWEPAPLLAALAADGKTFT
ncbi:3-hydroxyacyl-CoA dehydrogenase NAD-binding domain-containing protein [Lysobacter hankyongensis]|uniref:3-hydroxyacyl-CoA dehydrogenase NAD-binding domain-containing protein n=1 Tax=Lysobacter hankyongensis TaxID=1176535 RepID=A0ABP9AUW4_9GAMM